MIFFAFFFPMIFHLGPALNPPAPAPARHASAAAAAGPPPQRPSAGHRGGGTYPAVLVTPGDHHGHIMGLSWVYD